MYPSADLGSLSAVSKMSFANFTKYAMSFRSRSPGGEKIEGILL